MSQNNNFHSYLGHPGPFDNTPASSSEPLILLGTGPSSATFDDGTCFSFDTSTHFGPPISDIPGLQVHHQQHQQTLHQELRQTPHHPLPTNNASVSHGSEQWSQPYTSQPYKLISMNISNVQTPQVSMAGPSYTSVQYQAPIEASPLASNLALTSKGIARKQNVSCDFCRAKKIRCQRVPGADKCEQCTLKNAECTTHYVDRVAAKPKRPRKFRVDNSEYDENEGMNHRPSSSDPPETSANTAKRRKGSGSEGSQRNLGSRVLDRGQSSYMVYSDPACDKRREGLMAAMTKERDEAEISRWKNSRSTGFIGTGIGGVDGDRDPLHLLAHVAPSTAPRRSSTSSTHSTHSKQASLIAYLLSPEAVEDGHFHYTDLSSMELSKSGQSDIWEDKDGLIWEERATRAQLGLGQEGTTELIADLLDSYFSIVHPRIPMLDPLSFRQRFSNMQTSHPANPIPHGLLAVILALGAKFSDSHVFPEDRQECSERDRSSVSDGGRSRIIQLLAIRAREIVEDTKVGRVATLENIQTLVLMEVLLGQAPYLGHRYQGVYSIQAASHLRILGCDTMAGIQARYSGEERDAWISVWRIAYFGDSFRAGFYSIRTNLPDHLDPTKLHAHLSQPINGTPWMAGISLGDQQSSWIDAALCMSSIYRMISTSLSSISNMNTGIPTSTLREIIYAQSLWADRHLQSHCVPETIPLHWDYLPVLNASTADAFHHSVWLLLERSVSELGILEMKECQDGSKKLSSSGGGVEAELIRERIGREALQAALRISHLVTLLTEHDYLCLDPLILHQPIYEAGLHLAKLHRQECENCIKGLQQASLPYPQLSALSEKLSRIYKSTSNGIVSDLAAQSFLPMTNGSGDESGSALTQKSGGSVRGWQCGMLTFEGGWRTTLGPDNGNGNGEGQGGSNGNGNGIPNINKGGDPIGPPDLAVTVGLPMFT